MKKEYDQKIYNCAKQFILKEYENVKNIELILDDYLNYKDNPLNKNIKMRDIFLRFLISAQNANMRAGVIGGSIGGVENLEKILFNFNPKKVVKNFNNPEMLLDKIILELKPKGKIRKAKQSIWPKYSKTIISIANFLSQFKNAEEFLDWVDYFYKDEKSMAALPMILSEEVYGLGFPLACDFLKELGYINYGKPDVHIKDIFENYGLIKEKSSNYQILKAIIRISKNVSVSAYNVDKLFWLVGSGRFYKHENIPVKRLKKAFINYKRYCN